MKFKKFLLVFFFAVSLMGCQNNTRAAYKNFNELTIHYINVGQGDSELIECRGKVLMIDAGPYANHKNIIKYLKNEGVSKIDYLVATHPHEDHIGSMPDVINNFKIENFYAPRVTDSTSYFLNLIKALKNNNLKINVAKAGIKFKLDNKVVCQFLSPSQNKYSDMNKYSAVIKVIYGNTKFLFMGDAEKANEEDMIKNNYDVSCDVLKVGHHGSSTSSSMDFLKLASPKLAVISCGRNNKYGLPNKTVLNSLEKLNINILRTDINGTIVLRSDGNSIQLIK